MCLNLGRKPKRQEEEGNTQIKENSRWWFLFFFEYSPLFGEASHFDEHIFQMGWFNHQADFLSPKQGPCSHIASS